MPNNPQPSYYDNVYTKNAQHTHGFESMLHRKTCSLIRQLNTTGYNTCPQNSTKRKMMIKEENNKLQDQKMMNEKANRTTMSE